LILLRSVGRQCYSTIEISSLLSNWLMQFMSEKIMRTFRFCCKKILPEEHRWNTSGDLTVIAMLTGLQGGYIGTAE